MIITEPLPNDRTISKWLPVIEQLVIQYNKIFERSELESLCRFSDATSMLACNTQQHISTQYENLMSLPLYLMIFTELSANDDVVFEFGAPDNTIMLHSFVINEVDVNFNNHEQLRKYIKQLSLVIKKKILEIYVSTPGIKFNTIFTTTEITANMQPLLNVFIKYCTK